MPLPKNSGPEVPWKSIYKVALVRPMQGKANPRLFCHGKHVLPQGKITEGVHEPISLD